MLSTISKYIVPPFLKRIDRYLLVSYPHIWRTRGHYVVFYALIAIIFMFLAGCNYQQTLCEYLTEKKFNHELPFYITYFSAFLAIGTLIILWDYIQKFEYNGRKWTHFLTEISIYAICIFLLWSATFAFLVGYQYQKAYHLAKDIGNNYAWLKDNHFFKPIYLSHYQRNKLDDLNTYFKNGNYLFQKQALIKHKLPIKNVSKKTHFGYKHAELLEYLNPANPYYQLPTTDTIASHYYNRFFAELAVADVNEIPDWSIKALPSLSAASYEELINHINPNYYFGIDVSEYYFSFWHGAFKKWSYQKVFLETLSNQQLQLYFNYLKYLRNEYFHLDDTFRDDHPRYFIYRSEMPLQETHIFEELATQFPGKLRSQIGLEPDKDTTKPKEGNKGTEKTLLFLKSLSDNQKKIYAQYVMQPYQKISFEASYSDYNTYKAEKLDYGKKYLKKAHLRDSVQYFDVFFAPFDVDLTPIFTNEFCKYFVGKYNQADFKRLDNLLTANGFRNEYAHLSVNHQPLFRLMQAEQLEWALEKLSKESLISKFKYRFAFLLNFFIISCCVLASILFYILLNSNVLQFGNSIFISIVYVITLSIVGSGSFLKIFFCLYVVLFLRLVLGLLFLKYQWQNVQQMTNIILLSGVFYIGMAILWFQKYIYKIHPSLKATDELVALRNSFLIAAIVVSIASLIYLIIAYLLKRHLSLPKKH